MLVPANGPTGAAAPRTRLARRRGFALVGTVGVLAVLALMVDGMVQSAAIERKALMIERQKALRSVAFANVAAAMGLRHASEERHRAALREALRGACDIDPSVVGLSAWIVPDRRLDANTASEGQIARALADASHQIGEAAHAASSTHRMARRIVRARQLRPFENAAEIIEVAAADEGAEARSFTQAAVSAALTTDGEPAMMQLPSADATRTDTLGSLVASRRLLVRLSPDRRAASPPYAAALRRTDHAANWRVRAKDFHTHDVDRDLDAITATCNAR